ncbi:MAG: flippase-like domain-containing protein [Nitrospinota bacterium]|nr:flippase-like domain-containing protein [Nitrospinota bacterium]
MNDKEKEEKGGGLPNWARVTISFGLLGFIIWKVDVRPLMELAAGASIPLVALAFTMIFIDQAVTAFAWGRMLAAGGYVIPYKDTLRVTLAADFIGLAIPSGMGADMVRVVGLSRYIKSSSHALSSLFAFRVMGLGQTITIAAIVLMVFPDELPEDPMFSLLKTIVISLFFLGVLGLLFMGRIERFLEVIAPRTRLEPLMLKIRDLYSTFLFYLSHKDALAAAFIGDLYVQFAKILSIYIVALALGFDVGPTPFFILVPVVNILVLLPVSLAGLGVREGMYVILFAHVGLSAAQCLTMSLLGFGVNMLMVLAGGTVYLLFGFPESEGMNRTGAPKAP